MKQYQYIQIPFYDAGRPCSIHSAAGSKKIKKQREKMKKLSENKHICFDCSMKEKRHIKIPCKVSTNKCQSCKKIKAGETLKNFLPAKI